MPRRKNPRTFSSAIALSLLLAFLDLIDRSFQVTSLSCIGLSCKVVVDTKYGTTLPRPARRIKDKMDHGMNVSMGDCHMSVCTPRIVSVLH